MLDCFYFLLVWRYHRPWQIWAELVFALRYLLEELSADDESSQAKSQAYRLHIFPGIQLWLDGNACVK